MNRLLTVLLAAVIAMATACASTQKPGSEQPDDELAVALVETLVRARAHAQATPILRSALARNPDDPRLHLLLGEVLRDRGVYAQAERELRLAVRLAPKLARTHGALGILYDLTGRPVAAKASHERAIELAPGVAELRNNLGFSLYLARDFAGAQAAYEEGLRIDPTAGGIYVNLGFALAARGRKVEALRSFRQAGGEAAAWNNLGVAFEKQGELEPARRAYERALTADPGHSEATNNLNSLEGV